MGCRRAAPPGPSSLTRGPIWDLRDPGIGVAPRPWVPAFAGKTVGCAGRRVMVVAEGDPLLRDGRFANRTYGVVGELGMRWGLVVVGVARRVPLDTGFRR